MPWMWGLGNVWGTFEQGTLHEFTKGGENLGMLEKPHVENTVDREIG